MDLLPVNAWGIGAQCGLHPPACLRARCEKRVVLHAAGQERQTGTRYQLCQPLSVRTDRHDPIVNSGDDRDGYRKTAKAIGNERAPQSWSDSEHRSNS